MADWASVAQSVIGPLVGAVITLYATRQSDRERISAAILWANSTHPLRDPELPTLFVQNRSKQSVLIASVEIQTGVMFRRRAKNAQPLDYDDSRDLQFPYTIEPGGGQRFWLDCREHGIAIEDAPLHAKILGRLGVPYLRLKVRTIGGGAVSIDAADATPWKDRPKWLAR